MDRDEPMTGERRPGRWRLRLVVAIGLVVLSVLVTWRVSCLSGLPDIGDPFDLAAFVAATVPDETNAFVLYGQAFARLTGPEPATVMGRWDQADPATRRYLAESGEALAIWKRGTERPDSRHASLEAVNFQTSLGDFLKIRSLCRLGLLKASRLESEGDMGGAWSWLRAAFRCSRHCGHRGIMNERLIGIALHRSAATRINLWATNPKVDPALLRVALADVIASDALTPPTSDTLKAEYLVFVNSIADPDLCAELVRAGAEPSPSWRGRESFESLRRVVRDEPERSRRVMRLAVANWLAGCDLPASRRPPMLLPGPLLAADRTASLLTELYRLNASAPPEARALPPADLARWSATTTYACLEFPAFSALRNAIARERSVQTSLVVDLARQIYLREQGDYPATVAELVPRYLKALPDGYVSPP